MRRLLLLLCMLAAGFPAAGARDSRVITSFDKDWRFVQADPAGAQQSGFNDRSWPYGYSSFSYDLTPSTVTFQAE